MGKCYKCNEISANLKRVDSKFRCGVCKDYNNGMHFATGSNPEDKNPFPDCGGCPAICWECERKKCRKCGNVKSEKVASDCKICKRYNMDEKIDGTDTDQQGNWIDARGRIIGSCEECVSCGMKTVCCDCAITKAKNSRQ